MFEVMSGKVETAKKVVAYGPEGVGKSSLGNDFPKPLFIDTEGSTTELDADRLPRPSSWEMLKQQIEWYKGQIGRFKTLIIDTIDWAEALCNQKVCGDHNVKGIEDIGYGKGYVYSTEEFGRLLNLLSDVVDLGSHVVLIAHSQIVKFEQPDEMGAYDRYQLKLGKGTGSRTAALVKEWADMVLFINYKTFSVATDEQGRRHKAQGGQRVMYTTHHPAWDAKNRQGLPDELPLDYSHIAHIFVPQGNQSAPVEQAPPVQQQPEQPVSNTNTLDQQQAPPNEPVNQQPVQQDPPIQTNEINGLSPEGSQTNNALSSNIPKELRDLMELHQVSEEEIQIAVSSRGYYPQDTPIDNYEKEFINGVLVNAWEQMHQMIKEFRESVPFK